MIDSTKQIEYYKKILDAVSSKSTCDRAKVGAIIVKDKSIISTGYNGSPRGLPHCDDAGHFMRNGHCVRTVHAETNAILTAARNGIAILGCDMYVLYKPCPECMKVLINSGIKNCYYFLDYENEMHVYFEKNNYCTFVKVKIEEARLGDFIGDRL